MLAYGRRSNTGLDADGMRELCSALKENSSLTDLNLSRNRFGEEGASLLEGTLDSAPALRSLDVRRWDGMGWAPVDWDGIPLTYVSYFDVG